MLRSNEKKESLRFFDPSDRAEKKKKKKKAGIISFALSGAMVLGLLSATFLPKPESAKAFESLPEIETIKSALTGSEKTLKILEVVEEPDDAIFGYYIEGQEPKDLEDDVLSGLTSNAARTKEASDYYVGIANKGILGHNSSDTPLSYSLTYTEYYPWEDADEGIVQDIEGSGAVFVPASKINRNNVKDYMFYKVSLVPFYLGRDYSNEAGFFTKEDSWDVERFDFSGCNGKYVLRESQSQLTYFGKIVNSSATKPIDILDKEWSISGNNRETGFLLDTMRLDGEKPVFGYDLLRNETKLESVLAEDNGWYAISMNDVPFKTVSASTYGYIKSVRHELDTKGETVTVSGSYSYEGTGNGAFAPTGSSYESVVSNGAYVQDLEKGENGRGAVFIPASEIKSSDLSNYMFYKVDLVPLYVGTDDNNEAVFYKDKDKDSEERFDFSDYEGKFVLRESQSTNYYGKIVNTSATNPLDKEWIVSGNEREPYFILEEINFDDEKPVSGDDLLLNEEKKNAVLAGGSGWYAISMDVPFIPMSQSEYAYEVNFIIKPKGFIFKGKGNGQFNIDVTSVKGASDYVPKKNSATLTNPEIFSDAVISYEKVDYIIDVTNNNLFLKYVLDCVDEDSELVSNRAKSIKVDPVKGSDLSVEADAEKGQNYAIADYDLIVFEPGNYAISDKARNEILRVANEIEDDDSGEKAMIIDADSTLAKDYLMKRAYSKLEDKTPDEPTSRASSFTSNAPGFSYGYADGNLFFFKPGTEDRRFIVTSDITKAFDSSFYTAEKSAFYGVINEIWNENALRERAGSGSLDESVDLGKIMRYILNYKEQRQITPKTSVKILEIEPTDHSELRKSHIAYPDGTGKNAKDDDDPNDTTKRYNEFEPFVYDWFYKTYNDTTITLSTMSTYEFVGKIDDITEEYDLIYVGSGITDFHVNDSWNNPEQKNVKYDVPSNFYSENQTYYDTTTYPFALPYKLRWSCYAKSGDTWTNPENNKTYPEYKWFLFRDYKSTTEAGEKVPVVYESDEKYWYKEWVLYDAKSVTQYNDTNMNGLVYYNIGDINTSGEGNRAKGLIKDDADQIELRYSGNDLTEKKLRELKDFANAGYPVIFADNLLKVSTSGEKTVNNERVDVNSRMYSFISSVAGKANIYTSTAAGRSESNSKLMRQLSLSKPMIYFVDKPKNYTESGDHNAIKNRTLEYKFKILNETDPTPLSTTYSLHLYIDRGADGIFSEDDEVELSSSDLTGGDINSLMGCISQADNSHVYTLKRTLPDGVKGMVSWKLLVEKNGGGLHASEKGYAYTPVIVTGNDGVQSGQITINILQINPAKERPILDSIGTKDTYALDWQDMYKQGPFGELFKVLEDNGTGNYQLNITTVTPDEENAYYNYSGENKEAYYADPANKKYDMNNGNYDMLIIGFGDAYGELVDKTAAAVTEFIDSGKAVLFSHDNTAPTNFKQYYDEQVKIGKTGGHGYYFNTVVRDRVGLDRYGVTNDDTLLSYTNREDQYNIHTVNYKLGGSGNATIDGITVGTGVLYNRDTLNKYQIENIQDAGYDVAYKPSSNISDIGKTDYHAHGFTDLFAEGLKPGTEKTYTYKYDGMTDDVRLTVNENGKSVSDYDTDLITMENEGQITKYPFNIEKEAWEDKYTNGRNNILVSRTHLQYYQMNMSSDDLIVWYCLGHRTTRGDNEDLYSFVPNDVANQYYIFTRGNVTYSGCGHGGAHSHWYDPTTDEAKLFINTMIAAYRAAYAPPEFKFVASSEATDNVTIDTVIVPYETVGELYAGERGGSETEENDIKALEGKINFRFNDSNLDAGRTMGLSEFEIIFPDSYPDKIYEPDDVNNPYSDEITFTHDNFRLMIDEAGHLVFYYKNDVNDSSLTGTKTSEETVKFYDSDGNEVQNGKFQTGKVYSIDIQDLVGIFTKYTSRTTGNISEKDHYRAPDTFPTEFSLSVKPVTYFANGAKKVAENASTLTVTSLKMFDIG